MHVRQQLREAIESTLKAYAPLTALVVAENITVERILDFQTDDVHSGKASQFPAVNIICNDDETDSGFINPCGKYEVNQEAVIEVYVNAETNYGAAIDLIVTQVQKALFENLKLGLPITGVTYEGSRMSKDLSETIYAARVINYTYEYRVNYSDPETFA